MAAIIMSTKEKAKTLDALGESYEDLRQLEEERKKIAAEIRAKKKEITAVLASINKKEEEEDGDE